MNLILDTHTFLWFISGDNRLSQIARSLIENPANQPYLSHASLWEIAIKVSIGRLRLAQPFEILIPEQMSHNGIASLPITFEHISAVIKLPFHHKDPFDRLLIAQAIVEQLSVVSIDKIMDQYGIKRQW